MSDGDEDFDTKKAEAVKEKVREKAAKEKETVDFTVYDLPVDVKNQFISMAKLYYDNDVAEVMRDAITSLKDDRTNRIDDLEAKVERLEQRVEVLKSVGQQVQNTQDSGPQHDLTPTFGGQDVSVEDVNNEDVLDGIEDLKNKGDE